MNVRIKSKSNIGIQIKLTSSERSVSVLSYGAVSPAPISFQRKHVSRGRCIPNNYHYLL